MIIPLTGLCPQEPGCKGKHPGNSSVRFGHQNHKREATEYKEQEGQKMHQKKQTQVHKPIP